MSFWNVEGEDLAKSNGQFEQEGSNMRPIPDDTQVLALIDEAKWDSTQDGAEYISLRWAVMSPADFKNRKVFQKLWVMGNNPNQQDSEKRKAQGTKAKKMLAAIDHNAGGKLMASGEAPTDDSMARTITNKPMVLKLKVWEMTIQGEQKSGNWIAAVSPRNTQAGQKQPEAPKKEEAQKVPDASQKAIDDFDDDLPF